MKRLAILLMLLLVPSAFGIEYVDSANEGGTEDGEAEGTAWGTIAEGIADAADGEIIYVKASATYTLAATLTTGNKSLQIIGYTTTIADDGMVTVDGNAAATYCFDMNSSVSNDTLVLENFTITGAVSHGVYNTGTARTLLKMNNCISIDNGGDGVSGGSFSNALVYLSNCVLSDNGGDGAGPSMDSLYAVNCLFSGNTGCGFKAAYYGSAVRCVAVENGESGFYVGANTTTLGGILAYCIADKNTASGFYLYGQYSPFVLLGNLSMRNAYGYNTNVIDANAANAQAFFSAYGTGAFVNTTASVNGDIDVPSAIEVSADPFEAIWTTTTNEDWEGFDYRISSDESTLFDVLTPVGEFDNIMQAYTSLGPKVQNVAGGDTYNFIADPDWRNSVPLESATADQDILTYLVDSTDHTTPETGITSPTITISKNGGAFAAPSDGTWTELSGGYYTITLDATDTGTGGRLLVKVVKAGCDDVVEASYVGSASGGDDAATIWAYGTRTITGGTIGTYTGNTPQTGDSYTRLGAPTGASHAADLAALEDGLSTDAQIATAVWERLLGVTAAEDILLAILGDTDELQGDSLAISIEALDTLLDIIDANVDLALADTNELQGDDIPTLIAALPTAAENADAIWDETLTAHVTADSAAVAAKAILADTNELQTDDIPTLIAALPTDADVLTQAASALTTYDPPTSAEMEARTILAADYFDPALDTVALVTLVTTTTTNTDMVTEPLDAAGVRTAVGMASANLDTQLAALPTDADVLAQVNAALDTALTELTTDPGATPTLRQALMLGYMIGRGKTTTTEDTHTIFNDADVAVFTQSLTDDSTTFTRGEMADAP